MTVTVITDSASSLPAPLAAERGIVVVPMQVSFGDVNAHDGELELVDLLDHLEEGVTTSGPSPGDFAQAIERLPEGHDAVILTIASSMSSTYDAARVASKLADGRAVTVIDTRTAAGAEGLVSLAAARAAGRGAGPDEVAAVARRVIDEVELTAAVAGLEQLVRSGRVPQIAGWAGRLLGLQPLFRFAGGDVHRLRPAASREAALERIFQSWQRSQVDGDLHVAALHALAADEAGDLLEAVCKEVEPVEAFVGEFSPVMVAHTGPGLVGLAWWWDDGQSDLRL